METITQTDLAFATIEQIAALYRQRKLSPVELTKFMLDRIGQCNPKINAYVTVTAELAMAQARKTEAELFAPRGKRGGRDRGPLCGIPISLKDNIYTKDIRTTAGSKILRDFVPLRDAQVVTKLREAGAVLLGKTNMHEFAYGVTTNNPHFGPTRNPWDLARIPGGSSGGSAAAVAAGLCYGSIGTDTGGSVRIPASLCGIVGLKASLGRVSAEGIVPLAVLLDSVGPLARTVRDAALLLQPILVGMKGEGAFLPRRQGTGKSSKFRLGIPREFFLDVVSDEVRSVFDGAVEMFRRDGAEAKAISIPLLDETEDAGNQIAWAEATHYHQQQGWFPARAAQYGEDVRVRLEMGTQVRATTFLRALEQRNEFIQQLQQTMADSEIDALIAPTTPLTAPYLDEETTQIGDKTYPARAMLLRLNRPANLAGVPAISVPGGFTRAGLPVGMQLIAAKNKEHLLLKIAQSLESRFPEKRRPTL
ncbi:MAG TPA: amidase [Candidatus Saccharimonadales bacterium]|nr:amidase [Candidatus Saccharimonadales bacterium]